MSCDGTSYVRTTSFNLFLEGERETRERRETRTRQCELTKAIIYEQKSKVKRLRTASMAARVVACSRTILSFGKR